MPTLHGVGAQVGLSDPVFAAALGEAPVLDVPAFPYDPARLDALFARGDERVCRTVRMSAEWMRQTYKGAFTSWEDLRFLRENWEGPLVLKGIMSVEASWLLLYQKAPCSTRKLHRTQNWPWIMASTASSFPTTAS